jgi:hypothetical protein
MAMRLKVEKLGEGLHPSEVFVSVETRTGKEALVLDARSLENNALEVGWPVGTDGDFRLVELPRQTTRGTWRVWVHKSQLSPSERMRAMA